MTCGEAASRRLYPANLQLGLQAVEEGSARFAPPQFCHKLARATALEINLQGPHSTMATFPWPRLENELKNRTSLLVWQAVRTFSGVATFSFPVRERRSRTAKPQSGRHARGRPTAPAKCPCHPTGQETREYVSYHSYTLRNEVGFLSRQTQLLSTPLEERWVSAECLALKWKIQNYCEKGRSARKNWYFRFSAQSRWRTISFICLIR